MAPHSMAEMIDTLWSIDRPSTQSSTKSLASADVQDILPVLPPATADEVAPSTPTLETEKRYESVCTSPAPAAMTTAASVENSSDSSTLYVTPEHVVESHVPNGGDVRSGERILDTIGRGNSVQEAQAVGQREPIATEAATAAAERPQNQITADEPEAEINEAEPATALPDDSITPPTMEEPQDQVTPSEPKAEISQPETAITLPDNSIPPPPKTTKQIAEATMDILERYRLTRHKESSKPWVGRTIACALVETRVLAGESVEMVLPAFPFKSPNRISKVLGALPDKGEEVALMHLDGLCQAIKAIYPHGAHVIIVSDGLMYNDILDVSDRDVWNYGQALRQLTQTHNLKNIKFARLCDLLKLRANDEALSEEEYLQRAPQYRQQLYDDYIPKGFDVSAAIASDSDIAITYRGYIKFLEKDLEFTTLYETNATNSQIKKRNEEVAKRMIGRGKAFAKAIAERYHNAVRLSIHPSSEATKLSIALGPQTGGCSMTPWHSALMRAVDGSIQMSHALRVPALTHELIYENGRPSYFREKSDLYSWPGMDIEFHYMYPTGIIIKPREPHVKYSLHNVHMQKVRALAELCSPVVLRGFTDTTDRRIFIAKAYDLGEVLPWTFGILQEVKDVGRKDRMANNVISNEAMPMHYDGMFKFVKKADENGNEISVSNPPRFQYFTAKTPSPPGSGYTLFASSKLFWQYLPPPYTLGQLEKITWDCKNSGFWDNHMTNLPLVVLHPGRGTPCVRWHEPWPLWKTQFASCKISIENGSQDIIPLVDSLLYDRRVCLYFTWEKGDVLVSDNFGMLHTRTAFEGESDRELWRIHFD